MHLFCPACAVTGPPIILFLFLGSGIRTDGFKPNAQEHLAPILATAAKTELCKQQNGPVPQENGNAKSANPKHHPMLLELLAKELG